MKATEKQLKEIYLLMKRCRAFEERAIVELRKGMPGFIHSSVGAEAIPCGISPFLDPGDYVVTTHRGHSDIIARGARFDLMMAELYARETGYCKGVSGSMHIAVMDLNILGAVGIVGSGVSLASGAALGCKLLQNNRITVCYFGDGATCTGSFHEGLVFAAAFDLPAIFVCVNNQYEESTHWTKWGGRLANLAQRAQGYGIPGVSIDGNDAAAVADAAIEAIDRARNGGGPTFIEAVTYRIYGHHMGDPGTGYRSREEVDQWRGPDKDPIARLYSRLLKAKLITLEENDEIEARLSEELDKAVEFALNCGEIEPADAFNGSDGRVYSGRQVDLQKVYAGDAK